MTYEIIRINKVHEYEKKNIIQYGDYGGENQVNKDKILVNSNDNQNLWTNQ